MSDDGVTPAGSGVRVRVLVVDDDPLVRAALAMVLGGVGDVELVGEADDGDRAITLAAATAPHVVLMDIRMPRRDGISATEQLTGAGRPPAPMRSAAPRPAVVVLTTFADDTAVLEALRAGASGFLVKDTPPADIVRAVRQVAAGEPMLSPAVTRQLIAHVTCAAPAGSGAPADAPEAEDPRRAHAIRLLAALSDRERDVAVAVGHGLPNADIGARLFLSTATVKAHVSRVMVKLEVANRVQVALVVHDAGLV